MPSITRRALLELAAITFGSILGPGCRREPVVRITATPTPISPTPLPTSPSRLNPPPAGPAPTLPPTTAPAGPFPDVILLNANIITMDQADTIVQALAIRDGLILKTGTTDAIRALAGPNTRAINLRNKTITPGIIDAHNHLQSWGTLLTNYVPLIPPDVNSLDDLLRTLKPVVLRTPPGEWIQGYFWNVDPPTRKQLDPISPNNPVWLMQQGGHFASVNSAALRIAGITTRTRNPEGGVIEKDQQGEPTGVLYNHRAMDIVRAHIPQPSPKQIADSLYSAQMRMAEVGVTTFHDCNVRFNAIQGYLEVGRAKDMVLRSQIFYTLEWPEDLDRALNKVERINDEYMRFAGYKLLIDGQFPTWYTHEPHPGISWNMPTWNIDIYKKTIKTLHDTGLQIAVHCAGDAAIDLTLDAYEAAMKANPRPNPRHRLEHATLCSKDAVRRCADLGVVISCQPQFLRFSGSLADKIGNERASRAIVTRDWMNAGVKIALGSDTPTSPWYQPQATLIGAVLRPDNFNKTVNPEQVLTIQEALRAHTMGSAYAAFEEIAKGSLEAGKLADLAVWSDNIYSIRPIDIARTTIDMTMIGGKIVYDRSRSS